MQQDSNRDDSRVAPLVAESDARTKPLIARTRMRAPNVDPRIRDGRPFYRIMMEAATEMVSHWEVDAARMLVDTVVADVESGALPTAQEAPGRLLAACIGAAEQLVSSAPEVLTSRYGSGAPDVLQLTSTSRFRLDDYSVPGRWSRIKWRTPLHPFISFELSSSVDAEPSGSQGSAPDDPSWSGLAVCEALHSRIARLAELIRSGRSGEMPLGTPPAATVVRAGDLISAADLGFAVSFDLSAYAQRALRDAILCEALVDARACGTLNLRSTPSAVGGTIPCWIGEPLPVSAPPAPPGRRRRTRG